MDSSSVREIGGIGNYYGNLKVKQEDCRFAWSIENWDGDEWEEIPEYLFAALNRFQDEKGVSPDNSTDHTPTYSPPTDDQPRNPQHRPRCMVPIR